MTDESSETQLPYKVVTIRQAEPPPGMEGSSWHRYVIAFKGGESIEGCRQGDLKVATGAVQDIVDQLNERHMGKRGRVHLVPAEKKKPSN